MICLIANVEYGAVSRAILIAPAKARSSDGASERRAWLTLEDLLKELTAAVFDRRQYQRPIKKIVLLFTARFGNQQATVTSGAMKEPAFKCIWRLMLGAD